MNQDSMDIIRANQERKEWGNKKQVAKSKRNRRCSEEECKNWQILVQALR